MPSLRWASVCIDRAEADALAAFDGRQAAHPSCLFRD
jgi:hypothetical protein